MWVICAEDIASLRRWRPTRPVAPVMMTFIALRVGGCDDGRDGIGSEAKCGGGVACLW